MGASSSDPYADHIARFFDLALGPMTIVGMDGYQKRVNPAYLDLVGYTAEEVYTRPFMELVHPDDREATTMTFEHVVLGERALNYEVRLIAKDGGVKWTAWSATPLLDEGLVYAVGSDISDRVAAEEALRASELRVHQVEFQRAQALQMNDEIVQGLAVAKMALELGVADKVEGAVIDTLEKARHIVGDLLVELKKQGPVPGDLRHRGAQS
ncbi:MAG TPA: PAS domain S-box protein [Actinomycetota bacterium]|nr:PAS domain S-box protein [Actinomycetota bacterium]